MFTSKVLQFMESNGKSLMQERPLLSTLTSVVCFTAFGSERATKHYAPCFNLHILIGYTMTEYKSDPLAVELNNIWIPRTYSSSLMLSCLENFRKILERDIKSSNFSGASPPFLTKPSSLASSFSA